MIFSEPKVCPARCIAKSLVLNDRGVIQQLRGFPLVLHAVISSGPDAFLVCDLALAIACAAARAVPLVLGALRLRTKECRFAKGAIATILAGIKDCFCNMLDHAQPWRALAGIRRRSADFFR